VASVQFHLETIVGDVAEPAAVDQAVRGCEAVVHAGSVFSLDSRDARRVRQVNVCGTDLVLGAAHPSGGYQVVDVRELGIPVSRKARWRLAGMPGHHRRAIVEAMTRRKERDESRRAVHPGDAPRYEDFPEPTPNKDEALVRVRAASLKNATR
jgi:dihydroflavonol-4-reductase